MKRNFIILQNINNPQVMEIWGSLTEICREHPDIDYRAISRKKFPFDHQGLRFVKLGYKELNIIQNTLS